MPAVSAPYGLKPIFHPSGMIRSHTIIGGIASAFATAIYGGQPIRIDPTTKKVIAVAATNVDFCGVFAGVEFTDSLGQRRVSPFWPAGQIATDIWANIIGIDQPDLLYQIQADGTLAATAIGDELTFTNLAANGLGYSQATANATPVGTGNQGQVQVIDRAMNVDNDWGDTYVNVIVKIARHQFAAAKVAF